MVRPQTVKAFTSQWKSLAEELVSTGRAASVQTGSVRTSRLTDGGSGRSKAKEATARETGAGQKSHPAVLIRSVKAAHPKRSP